MGFFCFAYRTAEAHEEHKKYREIHTNNVKNKYKC